MANRMNTAAKLQIKVVTSTDAAGKDKTATRSFNISPALTDADCLSIGTKLGNLQEYPVHAVCRQDNADLTE